MFMELSQFGMLTALCKFTKWPTKLEHRNLIQTIGLDQDLDKLDYDDSRWICLDANGYTERFNDFVGLMGRHVPKDKITVKCMYTRKTNGTDNNNRYCKNWDQARFVYNSEDDRNWLSPIESHNGVWRSPRSLGHIITDLCPTVVGGGGGGTGLDFVMLGGMFGHDECMEKKWESNGQKMKF